jgi:chlorobactene glucosyltransferase
MLGDPLFGEILIAGYLLFLTLIWFIMVLAVSKWGRAWEVDCPEHAPENTCSVSVCIPARNEALNIGECVQSVLNNDWPELEVIVVDDRSEDNTGDVARNVANGDPRLRVIEGIEPPPGWAGKPWACLRAAKESKGAWLIFVDADVRLHPKAIQAIVETATQHNLSMLSLFGTWIVKGFWETVLIPAVGWLIRGTVDFDKVNDISQMEAFANGQCIAMRRDSYFGVEGHKAVKDQVLEDVRFAEVVKRNGMGVQIRPAPWAFQVRLYRSLSEIVNGYTKNLYEGLGRSPVAGFGAALFLFVCALLPFVLAVLLLVGTIFLSWNVVPLSTIAWLWGVVVLQFLFRYRQEKRDGRSGWYACAQPIANVLLIWILLRSTMKVSVAWKGRQFVDGKAQ